MEILLPCTHTEEAHCQLKILSNYIYEYNKGVRRLVLYTFNRRFLPQTLRRLRSQQIDYHVQEVDERRVNIYFGRPECVRTIRQIITRPLNKLTPEQDFILGTLLGYDLSLQCERYLASSEETLRAQTGTN